MSSLTDSLCKTPNADNRDKILCSCSLRCRYRFQNHHEHLKLNRVQSRCCGPFAIKIIEPNNCSLFFDRESSSSSPIAIDVKITSWYTKRLPPQQLSRGSLINANRIVWMHCNSNNILSHHANIRAGTTSLVSSPYYIVVDWLCSMSHLCKSLPNRTLSFSSGFGCSTKWIVKNRKAGTAVITSWTAFYGLFYFDYGPNEHCFTDIQSWYRTKLDGLLGIKLEAAMSRSRSKKQIQQQPRAEDDKCDERTNGDN